MARRNKDNLVIIYIIENTITGNRYIGSSITPLSNRWGKHKHLLRTGKHPNKLIQYDWEQHGESSFRCFTVETCLPEEQYVKEKGAMVEYGATYNLESGRRATLNPVCPTDF